MTLSSCLLLISFTVRTGAGVSIRCMEAMAGKATERRNTERLTEPMVACAGIVRYGGQVLHVRSSRERGDEGFWDTTEPKPCAARAYEVSVCLDVAKETRDEPPERMMSPAFTSLTASSTESHTLVFPGRGASTTTE